MLANLVFKAGAVAMLGSRKLVWLIAVTFGLSLAAGVVLLMFWPDWDLQLPEIPREARSR
jgi:uncharacterized membrane protein (DUF4010 family)